MIIEKIPHTCPNCNGNGKINYREKCHSCGGKGIIFGSRITFDENKKSYTIPPSRYIKRV